MSRDELLAECDRLRMMVAGALDQCAKLRTKVSGVVDGSYLDYAKIDQDWARTVLGR